jgi:hypothetical protein
MAGLTVGEARVLVSQYLDDQNQRRWPESEINTALQYSLAACLSKYIEEGGSLFDVEATLSTNSSGLCDLTTLGNILRIGPVQYATGSAPRSYWPVLPAKVRDREVDVPGVYSLRITYVKEFILSNNGNYPLIGDGAAAAPSTHNFDAWVCAESALLLGVKDNDQRPGLERLAAKLEEDALHKLNNPRTMPLSVPVYRHPNMRNLSYIFTPSATAPSLQLIRVRGEW